MIMVLFGVKNHSHILYFENEYYYFQLPVILKEILFLRAKKKMPWFKLEDVLFVTNKWDTIRCVVSDDKKRNSTWETLQKHIKDIWPHLNNKNIFRMNLIEVLINYFRIIPRF